MTYARIWNLGKILAETADVCNSGVNDQRLRTTSVGHPAELLLDITSLVGNYAANFLWLSLAHFFPRYVLMLSPTKSCHTSSDMLRVIYQKTHPRLILHIAKRLQKIADGLTGNYRSMAANYPPKDNWYHLMRPSVFRWTIPYGLSVEYSTFPFLGLVIFTQSSVKFLAFPQLSWNRLTPHRQMSYEIH